MTQIPPKNIFYDGGYKILNQKLGPTWNTLLARLSFHRPDGTIIGWTKLLPVILRSAPFLRVNSESLLYLLLKCRVSILAQIFTLTEVQVASARLFLT